MGDHSDVGLWDCCPQHLAEEGQGETNLVYPCGSWPDRFLDEPGASIQADAGRLQCGLVRRCHASSLVPSIGLYKCHCAVYRVVFY